ncbi:selenocysteine-specific translation elongation factor [Candidatus Lokiarchaeum ossiferum]|uniref:selenocysteine-specific translation elongation factor n=1 Tax=Candidatus Lokiarchaeum ossiferum TaxID=2951803 RepID=UPI00352C3466
MTRNEYTPIHIGLLGHIDAGKTAIARCLSEVVSTAGLDKHPQSKKRGITIDLGFTFFPLDEYMITLVDAPGHADLIRSVVSCANIIDLAILVVDAVQGPQVQTGEHLLILDILEIKEVVVLFNKIEMVNPEQISILEGQMKQIMQATRYKTQYKTFNVSAKQNRGFGVVKDYLLTTIKSMKIKRVSETPLHFLFDHHFNKKGFGTILTGTAISGQAKIGDELLILPPKISTRIKSIQKWKENAQFVVAGDRCGIAVTQIDSNRIYRGCFATNEGDKYKKAQIFEIQVEELALFQLGCKFGQSINVNHGMMALNARIFPFYTLQKSGQRYPVAFHPPRSKKKYRAILWLATEEYIRDSDVFLLSRLDLSPKALRIMGSAKIKKVHFNPPLLNKIKMKHGIVTKLNYSPNTVIVEGLAASLKGAQSILNLNAEPPYDKIVSSFGQKGNVEVRVNKTQLNLLSSGQNEVELQLFKDIKLDYSKSYEKIIPQ